ncbi:MAG: helix-turn-helix transcriptional regulator [Candidatus Eremiobacteraeota bacterium]|nr:helix-turn-helix transcriptional regulator [Candidatus Eremiobacteraeota bacterium]MCW5866564.1 helix-turn-helix transcriptional regulator [Candidatus Eremiobacteraeota bacterium]
MAEASGVSQKQISRYESLRVKPYTSTVKKLATALNCSVTELYRPRHVA